MAPLQRMLCLPNPKPACSTPDKKKASQTSRNKRKQSKASPSFQAKPSAKRRKTSTPKKCAQRTPTHGGGSQPGLSLASLSSGKIDIEPETLVSDNEDEAEDEVVEAEEEEAVEAEADEDEDRVRGIVGIDVGTTFSAISFVMAHQAHTDIIVNKAWPAAQSHGVLEKVETSYASPATPGQDPSLKKTVWGYSTAQAMSKLGPSLLVFSWFKLMMSVGSDLAGKEINDPALKKNVGKSILNGVRYERILSDWYQILYAKTMEMLEETNTPDFVENMDITWVISHPANYDEGQRGTMKKAALEAHMQRFPKRTRDKFRLVSEPEAAATITIAESIMREKDKSPFKEGFCVMTIDLGGGTIDIKIYEVVRTVPLRLRDACTGSAGWIGATSIYRAFIADCADEFKLAFTSLPPSRSAPGSELCRAFEEKMKGFTGKDGEEVFKIPLVAMMQSFKESRCKSDRYDTKEGVIKVSNQKMCELFKGVIDGMMEIVKEQRTKLAQSGAPPLTAIAPVGGLANCDYVIHTLKKRWASLFPENVPIRRPPAPWSAVVRGNALFGLKPFLVEHRKSCHFLGVEVARRFDPAKDSINDTFSDPILGKRVGGYVQWLIHKGQRVKHETEIARFSASIGLQGGEEAATLKVKLYSYAGDNVPEKVRHIGVQNVGEFSFTCNRLRKDLETANRRASPAICNVNVRARLTLDTGLMSFLVYKTGKNEKLGERVVEYYTASAE